MSDAKLSENTNVVIKAARIPAAMLALVIGTATAVTWWYGQKSDLDATSRAMSARIEANQRAILANQEAIARFQVEHFRGAQFELWAEKLRAANPTIKVPDVK